MKGALNTIIWLAIMSLSWH